MDRAMPPGPGCEWYWRLLDFVTWPIEVRRLKRAGFRHTGWRKWEYP
jgi:hypothetical protein